MFGLLISFAFCSIVRRVSGSNSSCCIRLRKSSTFVTSQAHVSDSDLITRLSSPFLFAEFIKLIELELKLELVFKFEPIILSKTDKTLFREFKNCSVRLSVVVIVVVEVEIVVVVVVIEVLLEVEVVREVVLIVVVVEVDVVVVVVVVVAVEALHWEGMGLALHAATNALLHPTSSHCPFCEYFFITQFWTVLSSLGLDPYQFL